MKAQGIDFGHYTHWKRSASIKPIDFAIFGFGYGAGKNGSWDINKPECKKEDRRILYSFYNHAVPWRDQADFIIKECNSVNAHAFGLDWENQGLHHFRPDLDWRRQTKDCKKILERVRDKIKGKVGVYANKGDYYCLAQTQDVTEFFLWCADPDNYPDDHPWSDVWWHRSGREKYDYVFDQYSWTAHAPD